MKARKLAGTEIRRFDSELEYILHRPEIFIGSSTEITSDFLIMDNGEITVLRDISHIPALYKIFNEVIDNSIDILLRNGIPQGAYIKVTFDGHTITVEDNGDGIPQEIDEVTGKYVAEMVFADLRTGSNFDDSSGNALIGRNGVGVSLTNIFSKEFQVQTWNGKFEYKQLFKDNSKKIYKPIVKPSTHKRGTKISFAPDWDFFKVSDKCNNDFGSLVVKRIKDFAFCIPDIKFVYNHVNFSVKKIKKYFDRPGDIFNENTKCRIGITHSPFTKDEFHSMGYVNSANTNQGTHIDYVMDKVVDHLKSFIKKKHKIDVKPNDIKNKLFLFISLWISNPTFGSQTKEGLTTPATKFADRIDSVLTMAMLNKLTKNENLIKSVIELYQLKSEKKESDKLKKAQKSKKKISKLLPAINKKKADNILMICEGDSAMSNMINVRHPNVAAIPIRGKLLNVYELKDLRVVENEELKNLMQAIGLRIGRPAEKLNYGKIGFLTDMDYDGNAIAGLLCNFFYKYWPEMFEKNMMVRVLSPLFTGKLDGKIIRFYSKSELENYKHRKKLKNIKYFKGLGGLGLDEYEMMLYQPDYINLTVTKNTGSMLQLLYSDNSDARKEWLSEVR